MLGEPFCEVVEYKPFLSCIMSEKFPFNCVETGTGPHYVSNGAEYSLCGAEEKKTEQGEHWPPMSRQDEHRPPQSSAGVIHSTSPSHKGEKVEETLSVWLLMITFAMLLLFFFGFVPSFVIICTVHYGVCVVGCVFVCRSLCVKMRSLKCSLKRSIHELTRDD